MDVVAKAVGRLFSRRYLFVTNTVSYGLLMTAGDAAVQGIERMVSRSKGGPQPVYDWRRTGRLGGTGLLMGPFNHVWYSFLDRVLPGSNTATVVRKILCDQLIASPFFAFAFFAGTGTLEGQPVQDMLVEFKKKFWAIYKADWTLWPTAQAINFYFLPPQFRVLYVGVVTCAWDGFLSYMKHESDKSPVPAVEAASTNEEKNGQNHLRAS
ncbi:Mpv17-like protein 2 [Lamellibrachia satsuma]|nr:Mpv17-like protein 2 [Lamellibrachia satsuma]